MAADLERLRQEICRREEELSELKQRLADMEKKSVEDASDGTEPKTIHNGNQKLTNDQIGRYSRQLILPELGVKGQVKLLSSKVLIVGAGGLGCPAAIYLAAAGVGKIGIVDYDEVEISNLHRQILHTEHRVGVSKAESVAISCRNLNSSLNFITHKVQLSSDNAMSIIRDYDIVLDATDNVATRYLLNDACVLAGKPLVSGSALRFEGQLTVYNHKGGPCYRCLYPKPPPPETVTNCSDGGVLGVVPGIIGCYQALEAIKIAADIGTPLNQRLMLFDAIDCTTRTIKLRGRQVLCPVCGDNPSMTQLIDYEQFCGARATDKDQEKKVLPASSRMTAKEYQTLLENGIEHVLLDVRLPVEMEICHLPHPALNIPINTVKKDPSALVEQIKRQLASSGIPLDTSPVVVVCRRGNDSQLAVQLLHDSNLNIRDIRGGLHAWARDVDSLFPVY
ncbi:adenylyltransferase and sulfurtransferase MOCS3-like isoform X2 [Littorina saxatilis]|uniref:Adenylyltransferase and sulfurtransferase MOCS3 homolog n=1 Tax=Littorina saxatilis TaxID=31220 RepID=A0AAN9BD61_9CAEN